MYTKPTKIRYYEVSLENLLLPLKATLHRQYVPYSRLMISNTRGQLLFRSDSEISFYNSLMYRTYEKSIVKEKNIFLINTSEPHVILLDVILEPLKILSPLVQVD